MKMIDAHIHADTRPYEDFEKMMVAGVDKAVTCAHDPLPMKISTVTLEHINRLVTTETQRALENGLKLYVAVGIHPRSIPQDYENVMKKLPFLLQRQGVVAIGEIGIEKGMEIEIEVFKRQLKLADDLKVPVVVHTPRENKIEITKTILTLLNKNIHPSRVLVDHVNDEIVAKVIDEDFMLGLTVQPGKMTPYEASTILREYGVDKFMLNSDMSSAPSDPLAVPKTVHRMRLEGFNNSDIIKVSTKNAEKFFKI